MMTESEELFVRFSKSEGWRIERIDQHSVAAGSKVPDFRLQLGDGSGIVVEVKQFDPNPEEREVAQGKQRVLGGKPGHRLRKVISKANNQLKALGPSEPGMLVVYNRTPCTLHDHHYAVLTAMRGMDVIELHVPANPDSPIVRSHWHPGPGRRLDPETNTSVSCIAVLREFWPLDESWPNSSDAARDAEYTLDVYHNQFAKHPLDPRHLAGSRVTHHRMREDEWSWEPYPIGSLSG